MSPAFGHRPEIEWRMGGDQQPLLPSEPLFADSRRNVRGQCDEHRGTLGKPALDPHLEREPIARMDIRIVNHQRQRDSQPPERRGH